jgi:hypothetical protein
MKLLSGYHQPKVPCHVPLLVFVTAVGGGMAALFATAID